MHGSPFVFLTSLTFSTGRRPLVSSAERPQTNFETSVSAAEFADMYKRDRLYGGHVIMLSSASNPHLLS